MFLFVYISHKTCIKLPMPLCLLEIQRALSLITNKRDNWKRTIIVDVIKCMGHHQRDSNIIIYLYKQYNFV